MGLTVPTPGTMTLLWTNPNPKTAFLPQTIQLDLKGYKGVVLSVLGGIGGRYVPSAILCEQNVDVEIAYPRGYMIGLRDVVLTDSGITFKEGKQDTYNSGSGGTTNNNYIIPVKIYGIKI